MTLPNYSFKIAFGGAGGVGKTTLLHQFMHNEFIPDMQLTIGVQFNSIIVNRNGMRVGLSLWDLGGQERFRFVQSMYMEGANAGFVFFDMSRLATLGQVGSWIEMFRENTYDELPIILVGTKIDLIPDLPQQQGIHGMANRVVNDYGLLGYTATSSKSLINVHEVMYYIVDLLIYHEQVQRSTHASSGSNQNL
ncbi:MAG: Rab family GTPase [Promethearchaeota archaeon]